MHLTEKQPWNEKRKSGHKATNQMDQTPAFNGLAVETRNSTNAPSGMHLIKRTDGVLTFRPFGYSPDERVTKVSSRFSSDRFR